MSTEKEKMLAGRLYDPADPQLAQDRKRSRDLCKRYNESTEDHLEERRAILTDLLGVADDPWIESPFFADYGSNITLGKKVFFNFNCVILDAAPVKIGDHVLFGPAVQIYTPVHPMNADERRTGAEYAKPVEIGPDVWVGGGAIICPGVTIGARSVIGAGSVVTRDIPPGVFAAGTPCRVIRSIDEDAIQTPL